MDLWQRLKNVFTDHLVEKYITPDNEEPDPINPNTKINAYGKPFHIEWDFIGIPFSIERQLDQGDNKFLMTVIGYYPLINPTNKPKEWFLPLDDEQHAKLVEEFKEWTADWSADGLVEKLKFTQDKTND